MNKNRNSINTFKIFLYVLTVYIRFHNDAYVCFQDIMHVTNYDVKKSYFNVIICCYQLMKIKAIMRF